MLSATKDHLAASSSKVSAKAHKKIVYCEFSVFFKELWQYTCTCINDFSYQLLHVLWPYMYCHKVAMTRASQSEVSLLSIACDWYCLIKYSCMNFTKSHDWNHWHTFTGSTIHNGATANKSSSFYDLLIIT